MSKFTPKNLNSGFADVDSLNENFAALETFSDTVLSRDGTAPNTMLSSIDMNSNRIFNLPEAVTPAEPITLAQAANLTGQSGFVSTVTEKQVATAGQTVYTLLLAHYTPGVDNISVYINGSFQDPSRYVQTATNVVTLVKPSLVGDEVVFVANQRNVSADTFPASNVTYQPPGGIYTNVQAKLQETVSIDDYGSLQDAIDSGAKRVEARAGVTYNISASIVPTDNLELAFNGATLKRVGGVFDMIDANGTTGFTLRDCNIDGDKDTDSLVSTNSADRFCGVRFRAATNCRVIGGSVKRTVNGEVQAEGTRAGIVIDLCNEGMLVDDVLFDDIDGTGCFPDDTTGAEIRNCVGRDCSGSSFASRIAPYVTFHNLKSFNSGYSGISINGVGAQANLLYSEGTANGYAGINIGHGTAGNEADGAVITNVVVKDSLGWGINITGSIGVKLSGFDVDSSADRGIRVQGGASQTKITNGTVRNGAITGILYQSGGRHELDHVDVYNNGTSGIDATTGTSSLSCGPNVQSYNNGNVTTAGSAGIVAVAGVTLELLGGEYGDDRGTAKQESGIWLAGCTYSISGAVIIGNTTNSIRKTSAPSKIYEKNIRIGTDSMQGVISSTATTSEVITNNSTRNQQLITFWPLNLAALTLGIPIVSSIVVGTSFTVSYPSSAAGTEKFGYEIN